MKKMANNKFLMFVIVQLVIAIVFIFYPVLTRDTVIVLAKTKTSHTSREEKLSRYSKQICAKLDELIARKAIGRDPELIEVVKMLIDPPATLHSLKLSTYLIKSPQAEAIDSYLKSMTDGFFVEAGGQDGETGSNTIFLEFHRKWKGIMIEADPLFYTQLLGKNRRCWSINACLSPTSYVTKLKFIGSQYATGRLVLERENKGKEKAENEKISLFSQDMVIPCFPLETLLLALNRTKVDFFSLDVEGVEIDILQSVDFQRLNIKTLAVEYLHGNKSAYVPLMESKGYSLVKEIQTHTSTAFAFDFIFAKN